MKLSICIPTLNRPQYLMQGINSIYDQQSDFSDFEVCISNNASNVDYSEVENLIEQYSVKYRNIKYYVQKSRISLDEHMHFVKKMATGDYIYYLGDDDYFNCDALSEIDRLCNQGVDLSIFNGDWVDSAGNYIGKHFNLQAGHYHCFEDAFSNLRDKGSFGAILVKRALLEDFYFSSLYGSSHAYGCYWLYMLNNPNENYQIVIPSTTCVNLRMAEKNYNVSKVYYSDIIKEFSLYDKLINNETGRGLNQKFFELYKKRIFSIKWMSAMFSKGANFSEVYKSDKKVDLFFLIKKIISFVIVKSSIYSALRSMYQVIK